MGQRAWGAESPRVLVTGQGPIAFACLLVCRALHWPTTVFGRDPAGTFRADLAQRLGARYVPAEQFPAVVRDVERDGFDLILECTGSDLVLVQSARWLSSCGVMVWLGSSRRPEQRRHNLDGLMRDAVLRNHVHVGTVNAAPRDFAAALQHLAELQTRCGADLAAILTERVSPRNALWHYRNRVPQGIKTVVTYDS
jgi:threonine dehydrogenase-like Zn-dependent dehydrogenase